MGLKRYDRARAALEKAAQLDPDNREALAELGSALTGLGRFAEADSVLARVVALHPRGAGEALIYRARLPASTRATPRPAAHWLDEARRTLPPRDPPGGTCGAGRRAQERRGGRRRSIAPRRRPRRYAAHAALKPSRARSAA